MTAAAGSWLVRRILVQILYMPVCVCVCVKQTQCDSVSFHFISMNNVNLFSMNFEFASFWPFANVGNADIAADNFI